MLTSFSYPNGFQLFAGVDEVGRGPLVGNVVTAAVILDPNKPIIGLMDSKKLTEKKREQLAVEIKQKALAWYIASASVAEIDELNILQATLLAMSRAINGLSTKPEFALVDGNKIPLLSIPAKAIVKGDSLVAEISAASIIAKVARDQEMYALDLEYPEYGFAKHKGYPTALHLERLQQYGATPLHRKSFAPVKKILQL